MTSFFLKPNIVFSVCKVKLVKNLYVGASVNKESDRKD